jgi:hypothetical protein
MPPSEIKALEKRVEASKADLQNIKAATEEAQKGILASAVGVVKAIEECKERAAKAEMILEQCKRESEAVKQMLAEGDGKLLLGDDDWGGVPTGEDAQITQQLAEYQAKEDQMEKEIIEKQAQLATIRANCEQLARLATHHKADLERLKANLSSSETRMHEFTHMNTSGSEIASDGAPSDPLAERTAEMQQVVWLRHMAELCQSMGKCKAEMIRPDCILVTVYGGDSGDQSQTQTHAQKQVAVHLIVDPKDGRLVDCQIDGLNDNPSNISDGNGDNPSEEMASIIRVAIKNNNIPFLIRQVVKKANGW